MSDVHFPHYGFKAKFVPLAVDAEKFSRQKVKGGGYSDIDIVYLGQYTPTKRNLLMLLTEAANLSEEKGE